MSIQKFTVSSDDSIYEAWPDIVQTENGKLICVFTECNSHTNRENSRIVISESTDRGRTWSAKKPLTQIGHPGNFFNNARISKLRDGNLVIVCDRVYKKDGEKRECSYSEIYVWYSDKDGTNWSEPTVLPFCGIVPDKMLELKNGRRIISAHFYGDNTDKLVQYLWYSDDQGATWSDRITLAADERYNLCEVSILEEVDGTLIAFLRENSIMGCPILKSISYNSGETWQGVYETPIDSGHRPVSGFLKNGQVMITYRYIPEWMQNIFAAFLNAADLKKTKRKEQKARIMPIDYDRNIMPDLGYTGWTQFDDGEIYIVTYIKDDKNKAQIRGYSFTMDDVVLPETDEKTNIF